MDWKTILYLVVGIYICWKLFSHIDTKFDHLEKQMEKDKESNYKHLENLSDWMKDKFDGVEERVSSVKETLGNGRRSS